MLESEEIFCACAEQVRVRSARVFVLQPPRRIVLESWEVMCQESATKRKRKIENRKPHFVRTSVCRTRRGTAQEGGAEKETERKKRKEKRKRSKGMLEDGGEEYIKEEIGQKVMVGDVTLGKEKERKQEKKERWVEEVDEVGKKTSAKKR